MPTNMDTANAFLSKAQEFAENGLWDAANAWTNMASVAVATRQAERSGQIADAINRLASVINQGKTWH